MNSKSLRRLAADHAALHSQPLPPNYLFPPATSDTDDLTALDILLAGPSHTPFSAGVWKLHLTIPPSYPSAPPTAHFRTPIFHPNVDPQSGGVCVETLKRDWDAKLTLRDVLVTVCCLLIQPNPDSALNAEAGALIQEGYAVFARRAKLMTSINAAIPRTLVEATREAQMRGQERAEARAERAEEGMERAKMVQEEESARQPAPIRRRRTVARLRPSRRSEGSPSGPNGRRRLPPPASSRPFAAQPGRDDVFGLSIPEDPFEAPKPAYHSDSPSDSDQENENENENENDSMQISPVKLHTPRISTPRRPHGTAVPLGELTLEDPSDTPPSNHHSSSDNDADSSPEYPPSPRKSPVKQRPAPLFAALPPRAESSRVAALDHRTFTPPNPTSKPLAESSPFVVPTPSPRKNKPSIFGVDFPPTHPTKTPARGGGLFNRPKTPNAYPSSTGGGVFKTRSPSSAEKRRREKLRKAELDARLWELCGGDVGRWNRGDFDGGVDGVFAGSKGGRW